MVGMLQMIRYLLKEQDDKYFESLGVYYVTNNVLQKVHTN